MAEGKCMGNEWVRPACCCLGFSFWLVQPFPLYNICFSSATGKPDNFNKTGRKHNALKKTPTYWCLPGFQVGLLIKFISLGYWQSGCWLGCLSKCIIWWTTQLQLNGVGAPRFSLRGSEMITNVSWDYSEFWCIPQLTSQQSAESTEAMLLIRTALFQWDRPRLLKD